MIILEFFQVNSFKSCRKNVVETDLGTGMSVAPAYFTSTFLPSRM